MTLFNELKTQAFGLRFCMIIIAYYFLPVKKQNRGYGGCKTEAL